MLEAHPVVSAVPAASPECSFAHVSAAVRIKSGIVYSRCTCSVRGAGRSFLPNKREGNPHGDSAGVQFATHIRR